MTVRLEQPKRLRDAETHVLPLVNIVFLLLVFFLIAGTLTPSAPTPVDAPRSTSTRTADGESAVTLTLTMEGEIVIDGRAVDLPDLQAGVAADLAGRTAPVVELKADSRVRADRLLAVLESLREAGADRVDLLTTPRRE
ncbi:MAG: biopolymer transporter ExbD [Ectothiorhodospiraceae bacterium]|jgi:biopolymer transport protein ExbD